MSRWLEASIEAARERDVPWDSERAARVEQGVVARRARSAAVSFIPWPLARLTLGALSGAALCASVIHVSHLIRERGHSEGPIGEIAPISQADPPEAPASVGERPVGDGGFD
jgi:hypothetical protein